MAGAFLTAWERAVGVKGWLTRDEAEMLFSLAHDGWCEVGSWKGRSAIVMGSAGPGHSVDFFVEGNKEAEWRANTADLPVTLHVGDLREVADEVPDVSLLFLDAEHSFEGTRIAYECYAPKVRPGGHIVFHDALPSEVEWPNPDLFYVPQPGDNPWPGVAEFTRTLGKPAFTVNTCQVFVV